MRTPTLWYRGLLLATLIGLFAALTARAAESEIRTVDSDGIVPNVRLRIVSIVSGRTVFVGQTDENGSLAVAGLDESKRYQAQTEDGRVWSNPFEGGSRATLRLDADRRGWSLYGDVGLGFGNTTVAYDAAAGGSGSSSDFLVLLDLAIGAVGPPEILFGWPVRPVVETGFQVPFMDPPTLTDPLSNEASLETSFRWRAGFGASTPIGPQSLGATADVVAAYVLSDSAVTTDLFAGGSSEDTFLGHAIDLRLGTRFPVFETERVSLALSARLSILVPVSGSSKNSAGVELEEDPSYRGILGFTVELPSGFGSGPSGPAR